MHLARTYVGDKTFNFKGVNLLKLKKDTEVTINKIAEFLTKEFNYQLDSTKVAKEYYYNYLLDDNMLNSLDLYKVRTFNFLLDKGFIDPRNKKRSEDAFVKFLSFIDIAVLNQHYLKGGVLCQEC